MSVMLAPVLLAVTEAAYLAAFAEAKARLLAIEAREERRPAPDDGLCEHCRKPRPPRARYTCGAPRCRKARSRRLASEAGKPAA